MASASHPSATSPIRHSRLSQTASPPGMRRAPSQTDEGYEDMNSQPGSDVDMLGDAKPPVDHAQPTLRALELLNVDQRLDVLRRGAAGTLTAEEQLALVKDILGTLPTWGKQIARAHLDSLMFFDPVKFLPYEMVSIVLGFLNPHDLLGASAVNREWRQRTQDEELWRNCFRREGWHVDIGKVRQAEILEKEKGTSSADSSSGKLDVTLQRRDSRKRRAGEAFSDGEVSAPQSGMVIGTPGSVADAASAAATAGTIRASTGYLPGTTIPADAAMQAMGSRRSSTDTDMSSDSGCDTANTEYKLAPTMFNDSSDPKVSWAYLYKQRLKLEKNWDDGKYQMFRLPHPQFPEQGHSECVYTIQYTGKYLVSGSRDRTIRIWDLDTCKLRDSGDAVLHGHKASVLCLQFDATPENDLIVSGGSDSYVMIWKFSTGELIKKMTDAHTESVLNLRFDHRYIVTCSKDKSIKIWNRHEITRDSPLIPIFCLPKFNDPSMPSLIAEHTLLASLQGHGAAVNAVMIHNDTIVSASGDRTIKAWDIHTGKDMKSYLGHTKGIACVQYDGRRIVSGSSDNSVRIFDADCQAEVACLHGHSNLVRTVQARFGDLDTTTDEELQSQARAADMGFYKALQSGMAPAISSRRTTARNPGSSRPEDMLATGTKIPPGGGGSRWAKIVSGSYDETIIIWKKDKDGKWVHRHRLHQDMLLRNRGTTRRHVPPTALPQPVNLNAISAQAPQQPTMTTTTTTTATANATAGPATHSHPQPQTAPVHPTVAAVQAAMPVPPHHPYPALHHNPANPHVPHTRDSSNRVFKLQFDARRIVCCSQNKVIVGWDFAAGDEALQRVGSWCLETY